MRIAARRSARVSRLRRSKAEPVSSSPSIQPPNAAEATGTTVCPTTGMKPKANSGSATRAEVPIRATDCRTERAAPVATGSSSSGTGPNSRSTDSDSLS